MKKRYLLIVITLLLFTGITKAGLEHKLRKYSTGDYVHMKIDLPIVITNASVNTESDKMMLLISGDAGYTGFDDKIAGEFAAKGIPVVSLNALKYFWKKKTPQQTTDDVLMLLEKYNALWKKENILLVGYSFGADVMPFIYNRLPQEIRKKIYRIGLLSPSKSTDFEVHIRDLIGLNSAKRELKVPAEIEKIKDTRLICFFGKGESNIPADQLQKDNFRVVFLQGGHHYHNSSFVVICKNLLQ